MYTLLLLYLSLAIIYIDLLYAKTSGVVLTVTTLSAFLAELPVFHKLLLNALALMCAHVWTALNKTRRQDVVYPLSRLLLTATSITRMLAHALTIGGRNWLHLFSLLLSLVWVLETFTLDKMG